MIGLIIIPTFKCNYNCSYCFQTRDSFIQNLNIMNFQIKRLSKKISEQINIEIAGGELSILDNFDEYFDSLYNTCKKYYKLESIKFITNLSKDVSFLSKYDDLIIFGSLHLDVISSDKIEKSLQNFRKISNKKHLQLLGNIPDGLIEKIQDLDYSIKEITADELDVVWDDTYDILPDGKVYKNKSEFIKFN